MSHQEVQPDSAFDLYKAYTYSSWQWTRQRPACPVWTTSLAHPARKMGTQQSKYKYIWVVYDEISIFTIKLAIDYGLYNYCIYIFNNNTSHLTKLYKHMQLLSSYIYYESDS